MKIYVKNEIPNPVVITARLDRLIKFSIFIMLVFWIRKRWIEIYLSPSPFGIKFKFGIIVTTSNFVRYTTYKYRFLLHCLDYPRCLYLNQYKKWINVVWINVLLIMLIALCPSCCKSGVDKLWTQNFSTYTIDHILHF